MDTSYFTRAEFREHAGDPGDDAKWPDADVDRAQRVAVGVLERWARSAWPTVDPPAGDGKAEEPRSAIEHSDGLGDVVLLERVPLIAVTSIELGGNPVSSAAFTPYPEEGKLVFKTPLREGPRILRVIYTYGEVSTPPEVKDAVMAAARSWLQRQPRRGKLPANTREYTAGRTTVTFQTDPSLVEPWTWDAAASELMQAVWGPDRPRTLGMV